MLQRIFNKIESRRKLNNLFWKFLVSLKDLGWIGQNLMTGNNPRKIETLNFATTYLCNSKCRNCNIWKKYIKDPGRRKEELTLEVIKKIFNESKYLKSLKSINLLGGESFLRNDFVDLCLFLSSKYPSARINVSTNGINPKIILDKLKKLLVNFNVKNIGLSISLDGLWQKHDYMRGVAGNYDSFIELINEIKKIPKNMDVTLGFTITPENYRDLEDVYNFSKKRNFSFFCQLAQTNDFFYNNLEKRCRFSRWNDNSLNELNEIIHKISVDDLKSKKGYSLDDLNYYYFSGIVDFLKNPERKINCFSGKKSLFLDPYGNVYPCITLNKKIGNTKEESFDKIWISEKASETRKFIRSEKCCCWTPCETLPSIYKNKKLLFSIILRKK